EFLKKLAMTRELVQSHHEDEYGFVIFKDAAADKFHFSEIVGGEFENTADTPKAAAKTNRKLRERHPKKQFIFLSSLHFHPSEGGSSLIVPSGPEGDLGSSSAYREMNADLGYVIPSINMIGMLAPEGETSILVYQEPTHYDPFEHRNIIREMDESLWPDLFTSQRDVLDFLRQYGYKAEMVHTHGNRLSESDLEKLGTFCTTELKPAPEEP